MRQPFLIICFAVLLLPNLQADWPDFRGPTADGHASRAGKSEPLGLPLRWSETENVKWKTPLPHRGWSTPVIQGKQIWVTTATPDGHDFFAVCVDADSGKVIFNERIFHSDHPEPLGNNLNGYASPSPVIEPGRVYLHFGSYGTACLDTTSFKVLWKRDDLPCRHFRGPGASPVLFEKFLILSMDGIDVQYQVALDKQTGQTIWKTDRSADWNDLDASGKPRGDGDFRKSYYTPLIVEVAGRKQLITASSKAAYGYDPQDGKEIWKVNHAGFSGAARPVYDRGIVYIATGHGRTEMLAVRAEGKGDVTDTHILWRNNRGVPCMPSPVLADGLLFMLSDAGILSALDAGSGQQLWQERLGGEYAASLLYADGRLHALGRDGKVTVLKPSRTFEVLATNKLDDGFMASPAITGRALILRTRSNLYRIESKETGAP